MKEATQHHEEKSTPDVPLQRKSFGVQLIKEALTPSEAAFSSYFRAHILKIARREASSYANYESSEAYVTGGERGYALVFSVLVNEAVV